MRNQRPEEAYGLFLSILLSFLSQTVKGIRDDAHKSYRNILEMAALLDQHAADKDVLERAYAISTYSKDYSTEVFKQFFRKPPKQYLIAVRIRNAKEFLRSGKSVKESAYLCGFCDELYFSRIFKRKTGMSPSRYREISRID